MKYRRLTEGWDFQLGHGLADYLTDSPETVLQAVLSRLKLLKGEWFNDTEEGTPWRDKVLGKYTQSTYDATIRGRILGTRGVTRITEYSSSFSSETRSLTVSATVDTVYGRVIFQEVL